jgi:hypothetical protein
MVVAFIIIGALVVAWVGVGVDNWRRYRWRGGRR